MAGKRFSRSKAGKTKKRSSLFLFNSILWLCILSLILSSSIVIATGANDNPSGATIIEPNSHMSGYVSYPTDVDDWFVCYVGETGDIRITLAGPDGEDFDLELYNQNLNKLAGS